MLSGKIECSIRSIGKDFLNIIPVLFYYVIFQLFWPLEIHFFFFLKFCVHWTVERSPGGIYCTSLTYLFDLTRGHEYYSLMSDIIFILLLNNFNYLNNSRTLSTFNLFYVKVLLLIGTILSDLLLGTIFSSRVKLRSYEQNDCIKK